MRSFQVDVDAFSSKIPSSVTPTGKPVDLVTHEASRQFFKDKGVEITPPGVIHLSVTNGTLLVRASLEDLIKSKGSSLILQSTEKP